MQERQGDKTAAGARKREILDGAAEVFAHKGFAEATTRDIADRVGLLSGSLYHHFRSKEEMAAALVERYLAAALTSYKSIANSGMAPDDQLASLITATAESIDDHFHEAVMVQNDWHRLRDRPGLERLDSMAKEAERVWVDVLDFGQSVGMFDPTADSLIVYRSIAGAMLSTARWYRPGRGVTMTAIAQSLVSLYLRGLVVGESGEPGPVPPNH